MRTIRQKKEIEGLKVLLFGHLGITLAAGMLAKGALIKKPALEVKNRAPAGRPSSLALIRNHIDYRVLLIGSLLPDLIDKPLGDIFLYNVFQNGKIFGHTLVLNILLAALAIYALKKWRHTWLLALSFGSMLHLILDMMWLNSQTLLWPLYGWSFAKVDSVDFFGWLPTMFHYLTTDAMVYVPEIIGFTILAGFAARLIQKKQVYAFIRSGITL